MILCAAYGCNNRTDRYSTVKRSFYSIPNLNIHPEKRSVIVQVSSLCLYWNNSYFVSGYNIKKGISIYKMVLAHMIDKIYLFCIVRTQVESCTL